MERGPFEGISAEPMLVFSVHGGLCSNQTIVRFAGGSILLSDRHFSSSTLARGKHRERVKKFRSRLAAYGSSEERSLHFRIVDQLR